MLQKPALHAGRGRTSTTTSTSPRFMLRFRQALSTQKYVKINSLFFEHTLLNADADDPAKRYRLYSIVSHPTAPKRIVCAPDCAFEMQWGISGGRTTSSWNAGQIHPRESRPRRPRVITDFSSRRSSSSTSPTRRTCACCASSQSSSWIPAMQKAMKDKKVAEPVALRHVRRSDARPVPAPPDHPPRPSGTKKPLVEAPKALLLPGWTNEDGNGGMGNVYGSAYETTACDRCRGLARLVLALGPASYPRGTQIACCLLALW